MSDCVRENCRVPVFQPGQSLTVDIFLSDQVYIAIGLVLVNPELVVAVATSGLRAMSKWEVGVRLLRH
jgi:hypothetical protein